MSNKKDFALGYAAAVGSAVLFSIKGVFAKKAYAAGATPEILLALRFGFALPVFVWIAWKSREGIGLPDLNRRDWFRIALTTALGYALASSLDFRGLQYVSVGLERVILYIHPTLVVAFGAWLGRRPTRGPVIPALLLSYIGLGLCFAGEIHAGNWTATLHGSALVFASAVAYAVFILNAENIVPRVGMHRLTAFGMVLCGLFFPAQAWFIRGAGFFRQQPTVYAWAFIMAGLSTVLPVYLFGVGLKAIAALRGKKLRELISEGARMVLRTPPPDYSAVEKRTALPLIDSRMPGKLDIPDDIASRMEVEADLERYASSFRR